MFIEAAGLALIWFASNPVLAAAGAALTGFGYSLVYPGLGVEAVRRAPPQSRGLAMGAYTVFLDVALGFGSPALGLIAGWTGLGSVFLVSAILVLVRGCHRRVAASHYFTKQDAQMKFIAATLATLSMLVSASGQTEVTKMREDVRMVAPALEKYAQGTLLGDVWKRPGLNGRDRSIVTLAALIARNQTVEMAYYLNVALDDTPMVASMLVSQPEAMKDLMKEQPIGRLGRPEEIAQRFFGFAAPAQAS